VLVSRLVLYVSSPPDIVRLAPRAPFFEEKWKLFLCNSISSVSNIFLFLLSTLSRNRAVLSKVFLLLPAFFLAHPYSCGELMRALEGSLPPPKWLVPPQLFHISTSVRNRVYSSSRWINYRHVPYASPLSCYELYNMGVFFIFSFGSFRRLSSLVKLS